jgi:G3E family GTPase
MPESLRPSEQAGGRIPVILLTGFLGSGKTTLLNRLLKGDDMADTAVIINEFGDVPIDHLLVESSIENAVVLQNGCICCTVRGDLVDTMTDLLDKRRQGTVPPFSRVAIETTGLADPSSIVRSFATERLLSGDFSLRAVVTTVDAVNGRDQLEAYPEAARQAALADLMILTKTDMADGSGVESLTSRLREINPGAEILRVVQGNITPDDLFRRLPAPPGEGGPVRSWMRADAFDAQETTGSDSAHNEAIHAFTVTSRDRIDEKDLRRWLASVFSLRGSDILRMKGIVAVEKYPGPVVIHAIQHLVHPPLRLSGWPDENHDTRIVFITQGLAAAGLQASFDAFLR